MYKTNTVSHYLHEVVKFIVQINLLVGCGLYPSGMAQQV